MIFDTGFGNSELATDALLRVVTGLRPELIVLGVRDDVRTYLEAAARAGLSASPQRCLYVGDDSSARGAALRAGMRIATDPVSAVDVATGAPRVWARIAVPETMATADWHEALRQERAVPWYLTQDLGPVVYTTIGRTALAHLIDRGFSASILASQETFAAADLYLMRPTDLGCHGEGAAAEFTERLLEKMPRLDLVATTPEGLLVALGGDLADEFYALVAPLAETVRLLPDVSLLNDEPPKPLESRAGSAVNDLTPEELQLLAGITPSLLEADIKRYTGGAPLRPDDPAPIATRFTKSRDNTRAVEALAADLAAIGLGEFAVTLPAFSIGGRARCNVEAHWPGDLPGIVIVSAHLDSTSIMSFHPYVGDRDPAPGVDDDGSGLSAVLAIARTLRRMSRPRRTIRFVLFNGEEQSLSGSAYYARAMADQHAPIVGVFQIDMIGYNPSRSARYEAHVGYSLNPNVERLSQSLATTVERAGTVVSPALTLEICGTPDGAEGLSDHYHFHTHAYAACCVSEDFFAGPLGPGEPNPNRHRATDNAIDLSYAADITRAIAAAVWLTAIA